MPSTLVVFGGPISVPAVAVDGGTATLQATDIPPDEFARLIQLRGSVAAVLNSGALPLSDTEAASLSRLYDAGVPVLLSMNRDEPEDVRQVASLFGISPTEGDVLLQRDGQGGVRVFSASDAGAGPAELLAAAVHVTRAAAVAATSRLGAAEIAAMASDDQPSAPTISFEMNFVDEKGEVAGVTVIEVVRSRTVSSDNKLVRLTSKATIKAARAGITDGSQTGKNLWGAYLPFEYRLQHHLVTDSDRPVYMDHFPESDGRTEFTQTDTENRGINIGGSTGAELSSSGQPDDLLAAKLPLNLSVGYERSWNSSLTSTFHDYSLFAAPNGEGTMQWRALIAPSLKGALIKRVGAGLPQLTEEKMTPMMRAATLNALSQWSLPGNFEGMATVTVTGGFELRKDEWRWDRAKLKYANGSEQRDSSRSYTFDLSNPYLSAERTVLIRTATGSGACLSDRDGVVLATCDSTDRRQLWGLDVGSRYINRATGRCLAVQPSTRAVVTEKCGLSYEQQWQWRADRLHSLIDHGRYRLYVEGGEVRYHAPEGRFQDYPVNPYGAPLEPWTNYPSAPRPKIDHQPAPAGSRPIPIPAEWATKFRPVSDDQRWRIEVLREGL
ncbi:RICIN domain-containing protein [Luteibacter sp. NPDC031894]|uniref:RICIN domain-containing protein n=1 Tax=Luteibacter sp. NPDC031894 TaxID=3390572 RepID=UPI003CFF2081